MKSLEAIVSNDSQPLSFPVINLQAGEGYRGPTVLECLSDKKGADFKG